MKFLTISRRASEQIRHLLQTNIIGTPGKSMVYQHQRVVEKLNHLADPYFVTLTMRNNLLATCCFCKRRVSLDGEIATAYYIRYFTFKESLRSNARKKVHQRRDNQLKKEVEQLLNGREFDEKGPHIYYGYIDPDNVRSMRFVQEFHFESAGIFHTVFFSRFFPRRSKSVHQLKAGERERISEWLKRSYADHQLFNDENIFYRDGYFVLKSKGEIVAGMQATPENWKIYELPGNNGRLLLSLISKVPLLNRLFNRDFRFLSVEAVLCKQGYEKALETLLSDVLARHKLSTAVMCLDPNSREYKMIKLLNSGAMGKLAKEKRLQVMIRSQEMERPSRTFIYASAFDVM